MITINKLANKLNVSRSTIYYNLPKDVELPKVDGVQYLDDDLEDMVTTKILNRRTNHKNKNDLSETNDDLKSKLLERDNQIQFLNEQIKIKDAQIDKSYQIINDQQQLITYYAQQLAKKDTAVHNEQLSYNNKEIPTGRKRGLLGRLIDLI